MGLFILVELGRIVMVLNNTYINHRFVSHVEFDSESLEANVFMTNDSSNKKFKINYDNANTFLSDYNKLIGGV